ncbi:MAG TPA: OsmC family protein [Acidimicrobiia bacterium]|nr:OsmC family protein [Acidimicrobiia bacterium]
MSINNVDLESVVGLVGAIQEDPARADTIWSAAVSWTGGFRSEVRVRDFAPVASDEPQGLGGTDTAPNPVEQLLGALGNCLAVGYAANASVAGIQLESVEIELTGDLDLHTFLGLAQGHAGFRSIEARVTIESEASPEAIEALHEKVTATSPVGHTLGRAIPLAIELTGAAQSEAVA